MSDEELAAIRERAEKATPGPWYRRIPYAGDVGYVATKNTAYSGDRGGPLVGTLDTSGMSKRRDILFPEFVADAEFIAHAREDIPALLAENTALREIVAAVAALEVDRIGGQGGYDSEAAYWSEDVTPLVTRARALLRQTAQEVE